MFTLFCKIFLPVGGEESTIEFMESQSLVDYSTPLLKEAYTSYGVVEHPFPLNCIIRYWYLGADFYNAVKIGIVQYVCAHCYIGSYCSFLFHFCISWPLFGTHWGIISQMILKMICALLAMILETFGVYGEGTFDWRYG